MPLPYKNVRYRAKRIDSKSYLRLAFTGKKLVEVEKKDYAKLNKSKQTKRRGI